MVFYRMYSYDWSRPSQWESAQPDSYDNTYHLSDPTCSAGWIQVVRNTRIKVPQIQRDWVVLCSWPRWTSMKMNQCGQGTLFLLIFSAIVDTELEPFLFMRLLLFTLLLDISSWLSLLVFTVLSPIGTIFNLHLPLLQFSNLLFQLFFQLIDRLSLCFYLFTFNKLQYNITSSIFK
jgi:hypothetical protein